MSTPEQIKTGRFYDDESQTGFDRIKNMYIDWWSGVGRAEMNLIANSMLGTFAGGAMWRTMFGSNTILQQFHHRHNASVFLGKQDARKAILNFTMERIIERGTRFGLKCAALGGMIGIFSVHTLLYRKDLHALDFAACTSAAFAATRYNRGPRAAAAAGTIGFAFGLGAGLVYKVASVYLNMTLKDSMDEMNAKINRDFVEPVYKNPEDRPKSIADKSQEEKPKSIASMSSQEKSVAERSSEEPKGTVDTSPEKPKGTANSLEDKSKQVADKLPEEKSKRIAS